MEKMLEILLSQCSVFIQLENIRESGFQMFSGDIERGLGLIWVRTRCSIN